VSSDDAVVDASPSRVLVRLAAVLSVVAAVLLIWTLRSSVRAPGEPADPGRPVARRATNSGQVAAPVTASPPATPTGPDIARPDRDLATFLDPSFAATETARRWKKYGVGDSDIAAALERMRQRGFSGAQLRDAGLVEQFLPARNIEPVFLRSVAMPTNAAAGAPVPFTVRASFPTPAHSFERWDIAVEGTTVTVRPVGSRSADPAAAVVVPVDLTGELPPLSPGQYHVRFAAIGEPIEKTLSIP
jgi:hypothetical protein